MRPPVLAVALLAAAACAPVKPQLKVKPFPYDGFSAVFPTGLRLVTYGLPHMPDVMVSASYRAGSVDDPPGKEGLAHLVEHLAYRARPGGGASLWNRSLAAGVAFNAITRADSTDYWAIGQPDQLGALLRLEADRLRDPLAGVDEATFARERQVVIREYRERTDGDDGRQLDWLAARALPGSPYSRAATAESLARLTLADAREFVRRHYRPADAILVVTGPEDAKVAAQRVLEVFAALATGDGASRIPPTGSTPARPDLAARVGPEPELRRAPVARPVLWLAWTVPGDADGGAPRTLAAALHVQQRLLQVRRDLGGAVISARGQAVRMDGVSLVIGQVELRRAEDARAVLDALRSERRTRVGLGDDDLIGKRWIRDELLMENHLQLEALEVSEIARHLRATGQADYVGGWQKAIAESLSSETTREFVTRYLGDDRLASVLVVPSGEPWGGGALPDEVRTGQDDHHGPARAEDELLPERPPLRPVALGGAARRRLGNGLEVVIAPRPGFRVLDARLVFKVEPTGPAEQYLDELALLSSSCGLAGWEPPEGELHRTPDSLAQVVHVPSDLLENALRDVSCRARNTTFDAPFFERLRRVLADELDRRPELTEVRDRLNAALLSRLFPGVSFGSYPDARRVRDYQTSDAKRFHVETFRPDRATLILAGDVQPSPEVWKAIEHRFGDWTTGAPLPERRPDLAVPERRQVVILDRPGAPLAELAVGVRVPPRAARDEPAFRVLYDHVTNGALEDLRVRRALTYAVAPGLWETTRGSSLILRTTVEASHAADTATTLLATLAAATTPLAPADLERARTRAYRHHLLRLGTSARDGRMLAEQFVNALPADEWDTFGARLQAVSREQVQAAARAAALGREVVVVTGDAARLEPALRAAGLTPEVLPAQPPRGR